MIDTNSFAYAAQIELDEVSALLKKIKTKLRAKQVTGVEIPDELLFLMSFLCQQEARIWWNIRRIRIASKENRMPLQDDIQAKMAGFRKSCARAMSLLPLD